MTEPTAVTRLFDTAAGPVRVRRAALQYLAPADRGSDENGQPTEFVVYAYTAGNSLQLEVAAFDNRADRDAYISTDPDKLIA